MIITNFTYNSLNGRYEHSHAEQMSSQAISQLLSTTLYHRRFFPYYAFCMVTGLDENGLYIEYNV